MKPIIAGVILLTLVACSPIMVGSTYDAQASGARTELCEAGSCEEAQIKPYSELSALQKVYLLLTFPFWRGGT